MSAQMIPRRDPNKEDRVSKFTVIVNFCTAAIVAGCLIAAIGAYVWQHQINEHTRQLTAVNSLLEFVCDDFAIEDGLRIKLHSAERSIHPKTDNRPYWQMLNGYMTAQEGNAIVRKSRCADLARSLQQ